QASRGHLIQERLEHMMIPSVEEHDLDRGPPQRPGGAQPPEPSSDDYHARTPLRLFASLLHAVSPRGGASPPGRGCYTVSCLAPPMLRPGGAARSSRPRAPSIVPIPAAWPSRSSAAAWCALPAAQQRPPPE